jgi:membrane protease YdiL (CAAX protease family)
MAEKIVIGPFGLRAGWSAAIFITLFLVLFILFDIVAVAVPGKMKQDLSEAQTHNTAQTSATRPAPAQPSETKPKGTAINEALEFAAVAGATLIMALIERRRMGVYGINAATVLDFLPGAFWGVVSLSALVFVLRACHVLVFDAQLLHGATMYLYGAKWLLVFLLVGLLEEYATRGFLQYTLTRGLMGLGKRVSPEHPRTAAFWMAAVMMSTIFGCLHLGNPGETAPGIAMVFLAGMLFSYALWRTGSLWWAIGFHMTWDWAQNFLWGVPDSGTITAGRLFQTHPMGSVLISGGSDGPEGSLLVLPTLLAVALIIRFTTKARIQPPMEQEPELHAATSLGLGANA